MPRTIGGINTTILRMRMAPVDPPSPSPELERMKYAICPTHTNYSSCKFAARMTDSSNPNAGLGGSGSNSVWCMGHLIEGDAAHKVDRKPRLDVIDCNQAQ
eukprot:3934149-Rhodomonas_salina.1